MAHNAIAKVVCCFISVSDAAMKVCRDPGQFAAGKLPRQVSAAIGTAANFESEPRRS